MTPFRSSRLAGEIAAFRGFNRSYTRLIGTLDEGLLQTNFSLAEARVLYELATRSQPNAAQIGQALGMDAGYLSRILAKLGKASLVERRAWREDKRSAALVLTRRGKAAFTTLNRQADEQARALLSRLSAGDRSRTIQAMKTIEEALAQDRPPSPPFILRPHRPGDMGWVVHREGALYAEEYGWDETFEVLVARIVADFVTHFDPKRERCWMAERGGEPAGHIFLVKHPERPDTAKLRLLLVEPVARGKGLGHALVNECIEFARACGYRKITLWTQSMLAAAHRIYAGAGFRLTHQEGHHSFGKDLVGQTWELDLGRGRKSGGNAPQRLGRSCD